MRIDRLAVKNFRNIREITLKPAPGVNILYGDNAQGKTNLLEAVWMFTGSRSFRGARESELIHFEEEQARLSVSFYSQNRDQEAELVLGRDRAASLNEVPLKRPSELAGRFTAVVFSPAHLSVVKDGPEGRRRMIDAALCQAYPKYEKALSDYYRIVKQRNALLRDIPRHAALLDTLDVWDGHLARTGAGIIRARSRYVKRLAEKAAAVYNGISSGLESLDIRYAPGYLPPGWENGGELAGLLAGAVRQSRGEDIRSGTSGAGPHRDDLEFLVEGQSARSYGSQGQQRSCVLAVKLAECDILRETSGEPPVILLDDVMSELDGSRRSYLLQGLRDSQIFITCCQRTEQAEFAPGGAAWHVRAGKLSLRP